MFYFSFYGITLNVISLFGIVIVIGILVDDGCAEVFISSMKGEDPFNADCGTLEVLPAVLSSGILFIFYARGCSFPEMGFVVIKTLIFSLIRGVIILPSPVLCSI